MCICSAIGRARDARQPRKAFVIAHTPSIGIERAHLTLRDAAAFLGSGLGRSQWTPVRGRYRAKMIGNGLRELDRFLNILLDEVALAAGWPSADVRALTRLHNTGLKLDAVCVRLGMQRDDQARLRALGRCRDTLFYCDGRVQRGDTRHMPRLTMGWPEDTISEGAAADLPVGDYLAITADQIAWVCRFYARIGGELAQMGAGGGFNKNSRISTSPVMKGQI
ncbi:hypothetical protein [Sphingomonas oligoaromativorans]|uniref:hypothetical protein n=1 Tax=Sphingomonas oligoaromativorans TaxID=575322 RepID=UPI001420F2C2|nr:hypothetical protein [Sphingomonas oligoaromativorans]NIJ35285.1 hypothetical protein [Sphingomonas oligoaromativorans]